MPHPFGENVELQKRLLTFLGDQTLPRIVRLTTPVFIANDRREPELVGSSIIVQAGPARIFVTATHLLNRWPAPAINVDDTMFAVRGQRGALHSTGSEPGSGRDRMDVSFVRLEPHLGDRIDASNVATFADMDFDEPVIGRDPFILCGYPERRNRDGLLGDEFTAVAYSLLMHDGDASLYEAVNSSTDGHLVLPFEKDDVWDLGKRVTAPNLEGVSGGGLWRVPINDEALRETRLSAIAVEQHPKGRHRHVLATRIREVLRGIHRLHPDLREGIDKEYDGVVA